MGEWGPHSHKHKLNMADFILNMPLRLFARVFGNPTGDPVLLKSRGVTLLRDNFENATVLKVKIVKKPKVEVASYNQVFRQRSQFNNLKETSSKIQGASYNRENMVLCSRTSKSNNIPYLKFFVLLITLCGKYTDELLKEERFFFSQPLPLCFFFFAPGFPPS